ncbi:hypothetical protein R1flu_015355 [Riccia fluitans]|uniref:Kinesin motor domain-containing protein n=1 Tax=Riccia fluitans TaxID=41844 RepID=A0ABD1YLW0_9MARC
MELSDVEEEHDARCTRNIFEELKKRVIIKQFVTDSPNLFGYSDDPFQDQGYVKGVSCITGSFPKDDTVRKMLNQSSGRSWKRLHSAICKNTLFVSKDENASLKIIDFGLADFIKPDARLSEIAVLQFDEEPWPSISAEAKDFLKHLLHKDPRKRSTAAQALAHPWIENISGGGKQQVASTSVSVSTSLHLVASRTGALTPRGTDLSLAGEEPSISNLSLESELVGSERIRTSGSVDQQLKEAQGINKFLVALGGVISAVNQAHIPYRNHKLTMLLSDYLRGNAKKPTVMNISPVYLCSSSSLDHQPYWVKIKVNQRIGRSMLQKGLIKT